MEKFNLKPDAEKEKFKEEIALLKSENIKLKKDNADLAEIALDLGLRLEEVEGGM